MDDQDCETKVGAKYSSMDRWQEYATWKYLNVMKTKEAENDAILK
jgi:hypothetical protein